MQIARSLIFATAITASAIALRRARFTVAIAFEAGRGAERIAQERARRAAAVRR